MFPKLTTFALKSFNVNTITFSLDTSVRTKSFHKFDMNMSGRISEPLYNISATPVLCKRTKTPRHKPYGLLCQLLIPEWPRNSISMDFIEHLPPSNGHTSILVVVDWLSKQGIFIPTYNTHWRHTKTMPYFVIIVWCKKLTKISLLKTFLETKKNWENIFLPNNFLSQDISQKPYNFSSIVVIRHLKKIQLLRWYFGPGKLQKSRS